MKLFYQIIYHPAINYILRNFLKMIRVFFLKTIVMPVSGKIEVKYKKNTIFLHTNQTCFVSREIFFKGANNYEFTTLFEHLVKQSEVFFDIGANIGYFTILGETLNHSLKTFSFEPSVGPLYYLNRNIIQNNLKNVVLIDKAVSDIDGRLQFYDVVSKKYPWIEYNLNGSNSLQNIHGREKVSSYEVDVITLASVMAKYNLDKVDLIKLDTECTEHLILKSSLDVINKHKPIIICEVYDVIENEVQECLDKMDKYELFQYKEKIKKLKRIKNLNEVSNDNLDRNFIFCPQEKRDYISLFIN